MSVLRTLVFASLLGACGNSGEDTTQVSLLPDATAPASVIADLPACTLANPTITYTPSPDDGGALETLLSASGISSGVVNNWDGLASGNLCGDAGLEFGISSLASGYQVLRGPSLYPVSGSALATSIEPSAIAVGRLSSTATYDKIYGVRQVASGQKDLVELTADPTTCKLTLTGQVAVGGVGHSAWVGVAVGQLDSNATTNELVMVKNDITASFVTVSSTFGIISSAQLNTDASAPWTGVATGDLDNDGIAEVVAVRKLGGASTANIFVYKSNGGVLTLSASAYFGGGPVSVTVGDFNGDGHRAIAVVGNTSPNFAIYSYAQGPAGGGVLTQLKTDPLDSQTGATWRTLAAGDVISGFDQGAQELIGLRNVTGNLRVEAFVYGQQIDRQRRAAALQGLKGQAYFQRNFRNGYDQDYTQCPYTDDELDHLIASLQATGTNSFVWGLQYPWDYQGLVAFLEKTADPANCVDGQQIRVWAGLVPSDPEGALTSETCSQPIELGAANFFPLGTHVVAPCAAPVHGAAPLDEASFFENPTGDTGLWRPTVCYDYFDNDGGWAGLLGALGQHYPNLVGVGLDDYSLFIAHEDGTLGPPLQFTENMVARFQSELQSRAPWMSFVPTMYFTWNDGHIGADHNYNLTRRFPDYGKLFDSVLFYFKGDLLNLNGSCHNGEGDIGQGCTYPAAEFGGTDPTVNCPDLCLAGECAETTLPDLPDVICTMKGWLARDRKLQLGTYFTPHYKCGEPSARYDYSVVRFVLNNPWTGVDGVHVYEAQAPVNVPSCTGAYTFEYADEPPYTKYCTVQALYHQTDTNPVEDLDLTRASCGVVRPVESQPFGYPHTSNENIIYKYKSHLYEFWREGNQAGSTDLTQAAGLTVTALSDPRAFVSLDGNQNVVYRGSDNALHVMQLGLGFPDRNFTTSTPGHVPPVGNAMGYTSVSAGLNEVVFRGSNNHVFEAHWSSGLSGLSGPLSIRDLSTANNLVRPLTALGDPFGYSFDAQSTQNVVFRSSDGSTNHMHDLFWRPADTVGDLTIASLVSAGDPVAYAEPIYGKQSVLYRDTDLIQASWSSAHLLSHVDRSTVVPPVDDPWGYFDADEGTNHGIYRAANGHVFESSWFDDVSTVGNDLTSFAQRFVTALAAGPPTAYYNPFNQSHHVVYYSADGHLHELRWGGY